MTDRGFPAAGAVPEPGAPGVPHPVPCRSTGAAAGAVGELAGGARGRVSAAAMTNAPGGRAAQYAMIMAGGKEPRRRRRRRELAPGGRCAAFATDNPGLDPGECSGRRGIEAGHRMMEDAGAGTHGRNPAVRLPCLAFSAAVCNSRAVANAMLARRRNASAGEPPITRQQIRDALLLLAVLADHRQVPKPPPSGLA